MMPTALRLMLSRVRRGRPPYLICSITSRCNMKCRMCFYHDRLNSREIPELSGDEWRMIGASSRDVVNLSLSGGEPFMREDIADIAAAFSRSKSLRIVSIPTNGTLTESICSGVSEMLGRLPRRVRLEIELSLDGIGRAHDFIRGVDGCFDRLMRTAERLRGMRDVCCGRLAIKTVTTAVHSNEASLRDIVTFGRKEIGADRVVLSPPHGAGLVEDEIRSLEFPLYSAAAEEVYSEEVGRSRALMDRVFSAVQLEAAATMRRIREGTGAILCPGPDSICVIAEDGEVFPCEDVRFSLGRIQDHGYSLQRVLAGEAARRFRLGIRGCRRCMWPCGVLARTVTDPSVMARSAFSALVRKALPRSRNAALSGSAGDCRMGDDPIGHSRI